MRFMIDLETLKTKPSRNKSKTGKHSYGEEYGRCYRSLVWFILRPYIPIILLSVLLLLYAEEKWDKRVCKVAYYGLALTWAVLSLLVLASLFLSLHLIYLRGLLSCLFGFPSCLYF
jgi:hypothetical protein